MINGRSLGLDCTSGDADPGLAPPAQSGASRRGCAFGLTHSLATDRRQHWPHVPFVALKHPKSCPLNGISCALHNRPQPNVGPCPIPSFDETRAPPQTHPADTPDRRN